MQSVGFTSEMYVGCQGKRQEPSGVLEPAHTGLGEPAVSSLLSSVHSKVALIASSHGENICNIETSKSNNFCFPGELTVVHFLAPQQMIERLL